MVDYYYNYYYKCQDLSDAITTIAGALYKVHKDYTSFITCRYLPSCLHKHKLILLGDKGTRV